MKSVFSIDGIMYKWGMAMIDAIYMNLLWIVFTLIGLGFTGGAATVALMTMFKRKNEGKGNIGFHYFFEVFKQKFHIATKVWLIMLSCIAVILINLTQMDRLTRIFSNPVLLLIIFAVQFTLLIQIIATTTYTLILLAYKSGTIKQLFFEATVMAYQFLGTTITLLALLSVLVYGSVFVPIFNFVGISVFSIIAIKMLNTKIIIKEEAHHDE
ncbi:DUF624 domain-containing protein [Vallitaleaceae bacterium 9-2]